MPESAKDQPDSVVSFGPYRLDVGTGQLWRGKHEMKVTPKAFTALRYFLDHPGQLVTKDDLFTAVWPQTVVTEATLASCIQELRSALRDDARAPRYIETVHRRGFRFIGKVVSDQVSVVSQTEAEREKPQPQTETEKQASVDAGPRTPALHDPSSNSPVVSSQSLTPNPQHPAPSRSWSIRRFVLMGLLLLVGVIAVVQYLSLPLPSTQPLTPSTRSLPLPDKPSLIVLPFTNLSGDLGQDYFSDGITEVLTSTLSRLSSLFVIARTSAFTYKGKGAKVQDISREMGVRYVLEGSVLKTDERIRIMAQLIDATTGYSLWSERYDRPLKDIFAVQEEIVQKIVTTLKLQFTVWEQGIVVYKTTDNLEAYDAFLRGNDLVVRFAKETNLQARQHFEKALEFDPQYAQAYASLGATYWLEFSQQWNLDPQLVKRAFELVQKAIALDDFLPQAHSALALIYLGKRQPDRALTEAERAVTLDPSFADGYNNLANVLNTTGKPKEALKAAEKALRLNPYGPFRYFATLGFAYHLLGQDAEAITAMKETIKRNPNFANGYMLLADGYVKLWLWQLNHDPQILEHALGATQQAVALNASSPFTHFSLGMVHLTRQHYDQAIAEMEQIIVLAPNDATGYAGLAWLLSVVGKKEEALHAVEQAQRLGAPALFPAYDISLGFAYYFLGHYEQAIPHFKKFLVFYPAHCLAHTTLAAIYSELGREADARAEVAEVLRINPNFSLEVNRQREAIKDPVILERHIAALRKAGLK